MTRESDQEDEEDRVKECLQEERRKEENGDYSGKEERNLKEIRKMKAYF